MSAASPWISDVDKTDEIDFNAYDFDGSSESPIQDLPLDNIEPLQPEKPRRLFDLEMHELELELEALPDVGDAHSQAYVRDSTNLYAAPAYNVSERPLRAGVAVDATRMDRFLAFMIDNLIAMVGLLPLFFMFAVEPASEIVRNGAILLTVGYLVGVVCLNIHFLWDYAQSIGKRVMGIMIVQADYSQQATLGRIFWLRGVAMGLINQIPIVGGFIALANILWIFGEERRCLHDLLANTRVVKADTFQAKAW